MSILNIFSWAINLIRYNFIKTFIFGEIITKGAKTLKNCYFVLSSENIFKVIKWLCTNKIVSKTLVVIVKYQQVT